MRDWRTCRGAMMTMPEREWLYTSSAKLAKHIDEPVIVHIGVQFGASLICCKAGALTARVIGVDPNIKLFRGDRDQYKLIEGLGGNEWASFHDGVHLLFIDGDHSKEGVHADIAGWAAKVRPGGLIVFHDYNADTEHWPHTVGVRAAVDAWDWAPTTWRELTAPDSLKVYQRLPFLKRCDGWGTVGIGTPYYKADYDFFRWWTWLLIGGLEPGDQALNDMSVYAPFPIPTVHNRLIARFLETDRDTLILVEDDHVAKQDIVREMRAKMDNRDFDIVCANYVGRRKLPLPVGYRLFNDPNEYGEYNCQLYSHKEVWRTGTQPVGGASFGLVLIRRWVLDAMLNGADPGGYFWCDWNGRNSQDIIFYVRAGQVGARTGVDRDANLGHVGQKIWTIEDFWRLEPPSRLERVRRAWKALTGRQGGSNG